MSNVPEAQQRTGDNSVVTGSGALIVKVWGFNIKPMFFLLLLVTGVTFSVLAIANGSVSMKLIELTTRLQTHFEGSSLKYVQRGNFTEINSQPLLTLFTTFKNDPIKWRTHWNVIQNWSQLQPKVRVILFDDSTEKSLLKFAHDLNWTILQTPKKSAFGVPLLKEMFFTCQRYLPNSVFYGYANGDILFDRGLVETMEVVSRYLNDGIETLIVGQRTNINIRGRRINTLQEVHKLARSEGKLFRADAEDYFFLAHNKFPWAAIPDVVIGRPSYDNFLVATAIKHGVAVVDATKTLIAIHQTGYDGNAAGFKNKDAEYNRHLIGAFEYFKGLTTNSQYLTQCNKDGRIELWRRPGAPQPPTLVTLTVPAGQSDALSNISRYISDQRTRPDLHAPFDTASQSEPHGSQQTMEFDTLNHWENRDIGQNVIEEVLEDDLAVEDTNRGLLTLFTVFTADPAFNNFHRNVLMNWATYHPDVTTVVFSDLDHPLNSLAGQLNWTVLPTIPQTGVSLPFKKMFSQVEMDSPKTDFYAYIKGDLLFGKGVVQTLQEISGGLDNLESCLLVGAKYRTVTHEDQELYFPSIVENNIRSTNSLLHSDIDENFIIAHRTFPWQHMPDVVIGQSVYDNYLVALALRYDFAVIDATQTLIALEQISKESSLLPSKPDDFDPNLLAALDYSEGHVTSAQFETTYDILGNVKLWRRQSEGKKSVLISQQEGHAKDSGHL